MLSVNVYIRYPSYKHIKQTITITIMHAAYIHFIFDLESVIAIMTKIIIVVNIPSQSVGLVQHIGKIL